MFGPNWNSRINIEIILIVLRDWRNSIKSKVIIYLKYDIIYFFFNLRLRLVISVIFSKMLDRKWNLYWLRKFKVDKHANWIFVKMLNKKYSFFPQWHLMEIFIALKWVIIIQKYRNSFY